MEDSKTQENASTFKQKNNRTRIGIAVGLLVLVVAAAIVAVIVVVVNKNNKNTSDKDILNDYAKFLSVKSSGLTGGHVYVTVRYHGNENCYTHWFLGQREYDSYLYDAGRKRKIDDRVFETSMRYEDAQTRIVTLRIYCRELTSIIDLDIGNLARQAAVQDNLPDLTHYTFTLSNPEKDTLTGKVKAKLRMNEAVNVTDGTVRTTMYIDGVNTSTTPYSLFEVFYFGYEAGSEADVALKVQPLPLYKGRAQAELVMSPLLAKYGGVLTAGVEKTIERGFITSIEKSRSINISSTETGEVVPRNSFGIYKQVPAVDTMDIFMNRHSFPCFVMGSSAPKVALSVFYPNNTQADIEPITLFQGAYLVLRAIIVERNQFPDGGIFKCRATLGSKTQTKETSFRFVVREDCSIDNALTGIIEQTSQHDKVRCTATGYPVPEVNVRLYDEYGPDLLKIGDFQVSNTTLDEKSVSVNLTISPPNTDIFVVSCVCKQNQFVGPYIGANRSIVLHPGGEMNWTLYDDFVKRYILIP